MRRFATAALWLVLAACLAACTTATALRDAPVRSLRVDGAELGYRDLGRGEPLLLVMGYAGTMDVWDHALVAALARQRRVILFDNRGVGFSRILAADAAQRLTIRRMAADALELLDGLGIERADVMGWSMGSVIAQEMALARPDKVRKLVLYGCVSEPEPVQRALARFAAMSPEEFLAALFPAPWLREHPDVYAGLPVPEIAADPAVVALQARALAEWPGTRDRLGGLRAPVLLVTGTDDNVTPTAESDVLAGLIEGSWLVRYRGGGHWLMYQTPRDLARTVLDFLDTRQDLLH